MGEKLATGQSAQDRSLPGFQRLIFVCVASAKVCASGKTEDYEDSAVL